MSPAPQRRVSREVVIWWAALILMVLGSAPVLLVTLSPDLRRPLQLRSLTRLERETGLTFPPETQLLLSRFDSSQDTVVILELRMPADAALAMIQGPPFDGKTTEQERLVTGKDLAFWGESDAEWQPDAARHFLCAKAQDEQNNYWDMRVLLDLDHPPEALAYVRWGTY